MIHPHTEVRYIDEEKGNGLFASCFIPCGTIIWVLDELDREITPAEMERYSPQCQEILFTYSYRNKKGNFLFCWDNGRYINHSFNANCCLTPYNFEIAVRDIQAGEELTDDYGYLNIVEPFEARSEKGSARTVVYPDDLLRLSEMWDKKIKQAFPRMLQVEQILWKFLGSDTVENILAILQGKESMLSIKTCYYDEKDPGEEKRQQQKRSLLPPVEEKLRCGD